LEELGDADLRLGEKSKITPEALPFPSTRRRDNAPPPRFVDGWATDAARRKIERNKKNARRGMATDDDSGEKAKNRSIFAEAASILFLLSTIVSLFLFFFFLSLSLSLLSLFPPSPLRNLLSGVDATDDYYYCSPSMSARMIRQTEFDCFSHSSSPLSYTFRTLFVHRAKQFFFEQNEY